MAFAADITGTLAGLIPAQQALVSGLAAGQAAKPVRKVEKRSEVGSQAPMTPAGELLPIELIREAVQECLQDSILDTTGALYALMADDEIVQLLHKLLGRPGDRETVGRSLQDVVDSFSALAAKDGRPADVVHAINRFTDRLKQTTEQLAELRRRAADQLEKGISETNAILAKIAETNRQITLSGATGAIAGPPVDAQAANLDALAKSIDFSCFRRTDGSVAVFTKQGVTLAKDQAALLIPSDGGLKAGDVEIGEQLSSGALHAFLHNRDVALPNVQSQLDTLAQTLQSRINQLSNRAIGGADARAVYRGSRLFADPAGLRVALAGGDSEILLLKEDGGIAARTTLSLAVKQYRRAWGLPVSGPWPIGQLVAALDSWLRRHMSATTNPVAHLSEQGFLHVDLPAGGWRLAVRDGRSLALQSKVIADTERPLGLQGQLILTDGLGNEFSTSPQRGGVALTPQDSLAQIAAKIGRLEGLGARLQPSEAGSSLVIFSKAGSDLAAEPDEVAAFLSPVPSDDQAREDVAVSAVLQSRWPNATSRCFPSPSMSLGLHGSLILRDLDGAMLAFQTPQPDWSLEKLVERMQSASDPRLTAALVSCGNQFAMKIATLAPDDRFIIEGWPEGWQTPPQFNFTAAGGELTASIAGQRGPSLDIAAGASLAAIAEQIAAPDGGFARAGLRAQMLRAGNAEILDIGHGLGLPLAFEGSAFGTREGQLDLRYNLRDMLGLNGPADQVVAGLANFLGLNDLFVAEPASSFDAKAAIGIFATTATPGTAGALALHPGLAADPSMLGAASTIRQISDLLCNALNIAEAGDLPRGSYRLAQYADAIMQQVAVAARNNAVQLTYHRTLLDRLGDERSSKIDVNNRLQTLMTLQQTYQDATQVIAGLARLNEQLKQPVH